jgi:hypothetical protein
VRISALKRRCKTVVLGDSAGRQSIPNPRHVVFGAPTGKGIQGVERCCNSYPKKPTIASAPPRSAAGPISHTWMIMRSGSDQRPGGRDNANRPLKQQARAPQNNQTFDSNGPTIKIRGNAYQIFERYLALAREAATSDDRIAAENFYQHAEHYFRIDNARREGHQPGMAPRPAPPDEA